MEKGKFSKVIILSIIALSVLFTITILCLMANGMEEPDTLIRYWFGTFTVELLACAGIKVTKVIRRFPEEDEGAVG